MQKPKYLTLEDVISELIDAHAVSDDLMPSDYEALAEEYGYFEAFPNQWIKD